jgi:hypothetical protein
MSISKPQQRNMVTKFIPECQCALAVYSEREPTNAEWDELLQVFRLEHGKRLRRVVNFSAGGSPNAAQRKRLEDLEGPNKLKVAVISDNDIVRMVTRIFSMRNKFIKVVSSADVRAAYDHVDILDAGGRQAVTNAYLELRRQLGKAA